MEQKDTEPMEQNQNTEPMEQNDFDKLRTL